jgi:hypothetical protein
VSVWVRKNSFKREKPRAAWLTHFTIGESGRLAGVFSRPIPEADTLLYLAALVAMFLRFGWPILDSAEGVFGIPNDFSDDV